MMTYLKRAWKITPEYIADNDFNEKKLLTVKIAVKNEKKKKKMKKGGFWWKSGVVGVMTWITVYQWKGVMYIIIKNGVGIGCRMYIRRTKWKSINEKKSKKRIKKRISLFG